MHAELFQVNVPDEPGDVSGAAGDEQREQQMIIGNFV